MDRSKKKQDGGNDEEDGEVSPVGGNARDRSLYHDGDVTSMPAITKSDRMIDENRRSVEESKNDGRIATIPDF